jgi:glycyl-tRNA synthetase (class II)
MSEKSKDGNEKNTSNDKNYDTKPSFTLKEQFKSVRHLSDKSLNRPINSDLTTQISFRISVSAKEKYMQLSPNKKKIVKLTLESIIFSLADDRDDLERAVRELGIELSKNNIQPILNLNINYNQAEAKAEARSEVNINIPDLLNAVNELERIVYNIMNHSFNPRTAQYQMPQAVMQSIAEKLKEIRKSIN